MKTIYKYTIPVVSEIALCMPEGATLLTVQMQDGLPQLWALVDPKKPAKKIHFRLFATGHPINETLGAYVGTFQMEDGAVVFHLFLDGDDDGR